MPLPQFKFDSLPQDDREWEVIAVGRVGRPSALSQQTSAELLLSEAGWRGIDPLAKPDTRLAIVDVSWLSVLRPGSIMCNGEIVSNAKGRTSAPRRWAGVTLTRDPLKTGSVGLTGFVPVTKKGSRPSHPIAEFEGLRYFPVRLNDTALAYVPVLELLIAVFRLGGPWLRHMIEGLGLPDRPEAGRLIDLSPGSFSVEDGSLICRGFSSLHCRSDPIPVVLGDATRHRSYVEVFRNLSRADFLNEPQFVDTMFPHNGGITCDVDYEHVTLKTRSPGAGSADRSPLLITRIRAARFDLGVDKIRIYVPSHSEQNREVPSRVTAQIVSDGELLTGQPVLKSKVAPSRSLEPRAFAIEDEQLESVPIEIVVDTNRSASKHYRRKIADKVEVEGSSTGTPHGEKARVDPASLQPMNKFSGITPRMQQLIDAMKIAAADDGAAFTLEAPPALYDGGDSLWQVAAHELQKLPSWIRPGGMARRIAVMSLRSHNGVLYAFDAETTSAGGERRALLVWSQQFPLQPVVINDIIIHMARANGVVREDDITSDPQSVGTAVAGRTDLRIGSMQHGRTGASADRVAKAILRKRDELRGL